MKKSISLFLTALLTILCISPIYAASGNSETVIALSDNGITVNGSSAPVSSDSDVYTGADIVYYEAGRGSSYGEGTTADEHNTDEAKAHTVVTITKAGVYRISGTLSKGQIAIDLGANAPTDPTAVVTLILDSVDITCAVAPAIIFYNVYECGVVDTAAASASVDTSKAGANVVIADSSVNNINGSYVARIYKEGTTKKLHKYDGAFYSKMSMNVSGGAIGNGVLNINAENEGLDSELHLTINGGIINITAQNDGINTNEDGVSVTTINGGTLYINGGFGVEGDGIDSNGYLVINGGIVIATANPRTGDGGIDADMDIIINGGTVIALGSRNDSTGTSSKQAYIELSYASTQKAGVLIRIEDASGAEIVTFNPARDYQSVTVSSPKLALGTTYHVYSGGSLVGADISNGLYVYGGIYTGGTQQQYTGTGMMGFPGRGMNNGNPPANERERLIPSGDVENIQNFQRPEVMIPPEDIGTLPEGFNPSQIEGGENTQRPQQPGGMMPSEGAGAFPENFNPAQMWGGMENQNTASGEGSTDFTLTAESRSFSGISDSIDASGKTAVIFTIDDGKGMESSNMELNNITAVMGSSGDTVNVPSGDVQITITDVPSENYAKSCLLSDGAAVISSILPTDSGMYQLTISVLRQNDDYTGTSQWMFSIDTIAFTDVAVDNVYYEAIQFVYESGLMTGTGDNVFSPDVAVSRAMAITVLGRLTKAETVESNTFSDVTAGSWYAAYVGWAEKNNIVAGYGNGIFAPDNSVTREQMCLILYNYSKNISLNLKTSALTYTDKSQIADWAYEAVEACAAAGLLDKVVSSGTVFSPQTALTRAELADMLMRLASLI